MAEDGAAALDAATLARVAKLARLNIAAPEQARLVKEMATIVSYVAQISALELGNVEAAAHAAPLPEKMRDDVLQPGLPLDQAMRNAPERLGDGFGVPKIIE